MASRLQRAQWASLGNLALMDFSTHDPLGNAYDYLTPATTPPILFGSQHKWVQGSNGFWLPQTALDANSKSLTGPIGGWLSHPPTGGRSQPQWAASPFVAIVTDTAPNPLKVKIVKTSGGSFDTGLAEITPTLAPGCPTPNINEIGLLVQPSRLDARDPMFILIRDSTGSGVVTGDKALTTTNSNTQNEHVFQVANPANGRVAAWFTWAIEVVDVNGGSGWLTEDHWMGSIPTTTGNIQVGRGSSYAQTVGGTTITGIQSWPTFAFSGSNPIVCCSPTWNTSAGQAIDHVHIYWTVYTVMPVVAITGL